MNNAALLLSQTPVRRILIIKLRHHGDMLLTTPVINTLHDHYPQAEIDVLLYQETRDMLAAHPFIHAIVSIDRQWKKLGARRHMLKEAGLIRQIRARRYDLVINLADQWRSAVIARLSGAPLRVGFDFPKRRHPLWRACHNVLASTEGHRTMHTVEQNLSILAPLAIAPLNTQVTMGYTPEDAATVGRLLAEQQVGERYIVVQPTSRWFFKCWSEEKMAETLRALQADGHRIVLTSGPDAKEQKMVAQILALCPAPGIVSLSGRLTLPQLAALIDRAMLFIGVDSVPMHMAAALGTPCIALFGPSKLTFWRPWQAKGKVIWAGDYGTLPDPDAIDTRTDERYLNLIPTDVVIHTARELL
ncbi:putative lipopolysaccharide heptosyltransferase III [Nissabacter sp. SGAir0207]|uniref:putative lipopolysaccharide heptosyltransferase III n=1 Tax=Nissabacter sp. SGAir0207 TaxID=2126321 RepID=UPI0010CD3B30|nr:putative lipopolysaccharide heptosyltransferase III [Nissabacter sp. SGAir0207]QCR37649.1 putative lipopolysaccharide heptosyltransferase III [Nissabacter sp. SGAir0207]